MNTHTFWNQPGATQRLEILGCLCSAGVLWQAVRARISTRYVGELESIFHDGRGTYRSDRLRRLSDVAVAGSFLCLFCSGRGRAMCRVISVFSMMLHDDLVRRTLPRTSNKAALHHASLLLALRDAIAPQHGGWVEVDPPTEPRIDQWVLALEQLLVVSVYAQAGLAKLEAPTNKTNTWLGSGAPLRNALALNGTQWGRRLSRRRSAVAILSRSAVVWEILSPLCVVSSPRLRNLWGATALAFHLTNFITMRISFWHLVLLDIPLFVVPDQILRYGLPRTPELVVGDRRIDV